MWFPTLALQGWGTQRLAGQGRMCFPTPALQGWGTQGWRVRAGCGFPPLLCKDGAPKVGGLGLDGAQESRNWKGRSDEELDCSMGFGGGCAGCSCGGAEFATAAAVAGGERVGCQGLECDRGDAGQKHAELCREVSEWQGARRGGDTAFDRVTRWDLCARLRVRQRRPVLDGRHPETARLL